MTTRAAISQRLVIVAMLSTTVPSNRVNLEIAMLERKRIWKMYVRDEYYKPSTLAYARQEYTSEDQALDGAYQLMYGLARRAHCKVIWIESAQAEG